MLKITGGKGVDVIYDPVGMIKGISHALKDLSSELTMGAWGGVWWGCRFVEVHRVGREGVSYWVRGW